MSRKGLYPLLGVCLLAALYGTASAQTTFTSQTYATGASPMGVVSGDFNRDGKPDLVVTDSQANRVTILLGVGGGAFAFGADYATGNAPFQVLTADFNHDGTLDLITVNSNRSATILLGNGDGTFRPGPQFAFGNDLKQMVAGDWDHDGLPDLAAVECDTQLCTLDVLHNTGQVFIST